MELFWVYFGLGAIVYLAIHGLIYINDEFIDKDGLNVLDFLYFSMAEVEPEEYRRRMFAWVIWIVYFAVLIYKVYKIRLLIKQEQEKKLLKNKIEGRIL